jgi:Xaa-Pro aminopeptidase
MHKDEKEIALMQESAKRVQEAMKIAFDACVPGISEMDIRNLIRDEYVKREITPGNGPLVAFGPNTAEPHHKCTDKILQQGEAVWLDMSVTYKGYWSDITRNIHLGQPNSEYVSLYELEKEVQNKAKKAIKPGVVAADIHRYTVELFAEHGMEKYFTHRTGHGIGMEVHELPNLAGDCDAVLQPGMTFTCEPGLYLPGKYGVRIEDDILVTKDGFHSFTDYPRELIVK